MVLIFSAVERGGFKPYKSGGMTRVEDGLPEFFGFGGVAEDLWRQCWQLAGLDEDAVNGAAKEGCAILYQ
jgi:hypothetical protein